MTRKAVILDGAKADFQETKGYVKEKFGDATWQQVHQDFKAAVKRLSANPEFGVPLEELKQFGFANFRKSLVGQTWIVYEYDDSLLIVHMFINTKRDFRTHLINRVTRA